MKLSSFCCEIVSSFIAGDSVRRNESGDERVTDSSGSFPEGWVIIKCVRMFRINHFLQVPHNVFGIPFLLKIVDVSSGSQFFLPLLFDLHTKCL